MNSLRTFAFFCLVAGLLAPRLCAYDRQAAIRYADQWSNNEEDREFWLRNSAFQSYDLDCSNFVSQIQIAGNRRFDGASGYVNDDGAMTLVAELRSELETRAGNIQSIDYFDPTMIPDTVRAGNPAFLLTDLLGGIFTINNHAIFNVGASAEVDQFNPGGASLLRYDGHTNERHHAPFSIIPNENTWLSQNVVRFLMLGDAPIIKYLEVRETASGAGTLLDWWKYDNDYDQDSPAYDYYANTYNGLYPISMGAPGFAKAGEVTLKVIFDTSMRQDVLVTMGVNSPDFDTLSFATQGWSSTHQSSDTWTGKVTIPSGVTSVNGNNTFKILAYATDGSQLNSNSYLNGYTPGHNVQHGLRVDTNSPAIRANAYGGNIPAGGIVNGRDISITVNDFYGGEDVSSVSGPGKLEVYTGNPASGGTLIASNDEDFEGEHTYVSTDTGVSLLAGLPEGWIYIRATDQAGNHSTINFLVLHDGVFSVSAWNQQPILDGGFAATELIYVSGATDTAKIALVGPVQSEVAFSPGDSIAVEFSTLYEGDYSVSAYDAENHLLNSLSFTNDMTSPWMALPGLDAAATTETSVTIQAEDYGSGVDRIVLDGPTGSTRTFSGAQTAEATFSGLSVGAYTAWVCDRSGNMEKKFFWVLEESSESYGKPAPVLEGEPMLVPMPGSGPASYGSVEFIRTLPDGSRYLGVNKTWEGSYLLKISAGGAVAWSHHWEWYSTIDGLETDTAGNAYVLAMGQLHKFTPEGGRASVDVGEYGSYSYESYRTSNLAVNSALGRVYVYSEVSPDHVLSAYDSSLNLVNSVQNPGMLLVGSIVVDGTGTLWMTGTDMENGLLAYRYAADLSAAAVFSQPTELYDSDHDGIYMPAAADPRGGVAVCNNGVFWRITDAGFSAPSLAQIDKYSSFLVDGEGSILAVAENPETNDQSIVKISTDNAYIWEPPYLDIGATLMSKTISMSLASVGKLDVAFSNGSAISLSRYAPMVSTVSEDGLASVESIGEEVAVSPVTPEVYETASAAVSDSGLLAVTTFYVVSSGSGELPLPAQITLTYSTENVYAQDLDPSAIYLYEYDEENGWVYMEEQETDEDNNRIRARIMGVARVFAILGEPGDYSAPLVELSVNEVAVGDGESADMAAADSVTITAQDVGYAGVREIVYATDAEFSDETLYEEPFTLAEGTHTIYYQAVDNAFNFSDVKVAYLNVGGQPGYTAELSVSSGPIGLPFTITGTGFGAYSAGLTTVLIGGATAPLTLWSTDTIKGTVPGTLAAGEHSVAVMRGAEVLATAAPFTVTVPVLLEVTPSSGAIGIPFTITGESFGNYVAGFTRVLLGGATMPLTLWTDTKIQGTVPGTLPVGDYELVVERALNGGVVQSSTAVFSLRNMEAYWLAPSSGPIGMPFTITGVGFGNYSSVYTHVLIGDTTAPLALWTDSKIQGTIPGSLVSGQYPVSVERRTSDGGVMQTSPMTFEVVTVDVASMTPVAGPIGLPFSIYGGNFGNYVAGYTRVLMGGSTCPLTLWTADKIQGAVPGALGPGEYPVLVERELNGGIVQSQALAFVVSTPTAYNMAPSSGPIGLPFTINGEHFGNYSAAFTGVLINGATVPLTLWTDTQIKGTIPGNLAPGQYPVVVDRRTTDGGAVQTAPLTFEVVGVNVASMTPVAGPIGMPFTIYGGNFGNYSAGYTKVLIGGTTCPLTLWTDAKIQGTVPGSLPAGEYSMVVERSLNGGQVQSVPLNFSVTVPAPYTLAPSSGAIGLPFTITGASFGNYVANYTKVLIGGTSCPLTLWTDTKIQGTMPGSLSPGEYPVVVTRSLNGGSVESSSMTFLVAAPVAYALSPSSGPIGLPFTITGVGFGNYVANYTKVLIGGAAAPLTLWTDTKIQGTVPGSLVDGGHEVVVERALNGGVVRSSTFSFTVGTPYLGAVSPSTAAVIAPFTITGYNFGNYVANYTKVLINGTTTALTLWTDTKIQGKLPYLLAGTYPVQVQRYLNGGLAESATAYISVEEPTISSMTPVSGAVGTVFNLYGTGFGPYDATIAKVFMGGAQCALGLWTDTRITGTVPSGLSYGTHTVVAMRGQAVSNGLEYYIPGGYSPSMMRLGTSPSALEFKLGEVYVYPDPAKGGKVPTFHIEVGTADSVKLRVYTVAGQLAHEATLTGSPQAVGSVYAYEYAWTGRIASGVYYYTMEAERAGKKLKAKGRFSVVR